MPEFKVGDRVRSRAFRDTAGRVVGVRYVPEVGHHEVFWEVTHRQPDGPWIVFNHSKHFPGHHEGRVVTDAWDTGLEHID
ncbi:hypothetical protein SEA_ECLIPTUS_46 [Gordonia phage Ecliptus]|nr:hypothetical protein SEA_ECLIPTUS_46 [Gordonia phage Ecliptus]